MPAEIPEGTPIIGLEITRSSLRKIDADTTCKYDATLAELAHDSRPEACVMAMQLAIQAGFQPEAHGIEPGDLFAIHITTISECARQVRSHHRASRSVGMLLMQIAEP